MAKDDTRKADTTPDEETKRRRGGSNGGQAGDAAGEAAAAADAALDQAVHATTGVMQATTDVMAEGARAARSTAEAATEAGSDGMQRAARAGREAAAGLAAMAEAPAPRSLTGSAFPPALHGSAKEAAGRAGKAASDQFEAVTTELSDQLSSLMEDNAALFENLTSARGLPEMMGAYQSWMMRRMSRTAGLQMAIWNTWLRTAQVAARPNQGGAEHR